MAQKMLERQQVMSVFVEMSSEGVAERVAGEAVRPTELFLSRSDMTIQELLVIRSVEVVLLREEIVTRPAALTPVFHKYIKYRR